MRLFERDMVYVASKVRFVKLRLAQ
jgi:hypothetical protein